MEAFWQDLRYGLRTLARSPGFTAVAVLTLALGIGATTAIFTVVNRVLIEPLPFKGSAKLVFLNRFNPQAGFMVTPSRELIRLWREQADSFEGIEAYDSREWTLTETGEPELIPGAFISPGLLPFLGVTPIRGRGFHSEDVGSAAEKTALISDTLWKERFGGNLDVLGKPLTLNGQSHVVIGVLPARFHFPGNETQVWIPVAFDTVSGSPTRMQAIARLKPDISLERAQAEMDLISARIAQADDKERGWRTRVSLPQVNPQLQKALIILLVATGMVLLIACANVSNLLLARGLSNQREIAIRSALGAHRIRLVRQLWMESLVLASLGALMGVLFSSWGLQVMVAFRPQDLQGFAEVYMDSRVLAFASASSIMAALIFGLTPAWRLSKPDIHDALKVAAATHSGGRGHHALRMALAAGQIALCVILLIAAGLLTRSFVRLQSVDFGFDPGQVLVTRIALPGERYSKADREVFFDQLAERVQAVSGVQSVAVAGMVPPRQAGIFGFGKLEIEDGALPESAAPFQFSGGFVDRNYFETLRIPILRGRSFTAEECEQVSRVIIVNEDTARRLWTLDEAVGKRLRFEGDDGWRTIVGVVGDVAHSGPLQRSPGFQFYFPVREFLRGFDAERFSSFVVIRTQPDPGQLVAAVKAQVWSLDASLPIPEIAAMESLVADSIVRPRFNMILFSAFGILALILALAGVYGVVSYWVSERVHEIGIRRALGAPGPDIIRMVLKQGGMASLLGTIVGLAGAFASTRILSSFLFGVEATDLLTFMLVSVVLLLMAVLACYIPARRATKVDPMIALRNE